MRSSLRRCRSGTLVGVSEFARSQPSKSSRRSYLAKLVILETSRGRLVPILGRQCVLIDPSRRISGQPCPATGRPAKRGWEASVFIEDEGDNQEAP